MVKTLYSILHRSLDLTQIFVKNIKNKIKKTDLYGVTGTSLEIKKSRGFSPLDSLLLYIFSYFIIQLFSLKIFLSILLNTRFR